MRKLFHYLIYIIATILCVMVSGYIFAESPQTVQRLPLGSVTAQGWLRDQLIRSKNGLGGNLDLLEPGLIALPYVTREHGSPHSAGWSGEISGTYWFGLVQLAFTLKDPELIEKADNWVHAFLKLQEEDGYLGSYRLDDNRLEDYSAWSANWGYRALLSWYEATGEQEVLDAVHRGLLWYVEKWKGDQKTDYLGTTLMESMIDVWLLTGDKRLGDWCVDYLEWLDTHDTFFHGKKSLERAELEYGEDHTVGFAENVKHPALVYLYNRDSTFLKASENGIRQSLDKVWQCTGGPANYFEFQAPPSSNGETEYCAWSSWVNTFSRMLCITNQPSYGDLMEETLFNGAQGGRFKDERAIAYATSPNQIYATMTSSLFACSPAMGVYAPCYPTACCPVQSVRIHPEYIHAMFLRDGEGNLELPVYGPARAEFTDGSNHIVISEETLYPFDEMITLRISAQEPWTKAIRLKKPRWCDRYELKRDGKPVDVTEEDGWLVIRQEWRENELSIRFVMTPRLVPVADKIFKACPLLTVQCGPLLFAKKYEEKKTPVPGSPLTPLPEGWSWFDVTCKSMPVFYSIDPDLVTHPDRIVKRVRTTAYPWENSPITLELSMIRSVYHGWGWPKTRGEHSLGHWQHTPTPCENPVTPDEGNSREEVELVPFGCTLLRQACFTSVKRLTPGEYPTKGEAN